MSQSHIWIIAAIWLVSDFIQTGITVAYFQNLYPEVADYRQDLGLAAFLGLGGPVGLIVAFFASGFCQYGWQLSPNSKKETA